MTRLILVTGGSGQVGTALSRLTWPADVELDLPGRGELDLRDPDAIVRYVQDRSFEAIINAGAYTMVDRSEDDAVAAFLINGLAPAALGSASGKAGIPIIHVSTDYVFDGTREGFHAEDTPVAPLGVYGASKRSGELAIGATNPRHAIVRTAWVVSDTGSNFIKTMLRVGATHPLVSVVDDQFGCPTAASDLAMALQTITLRHIADPDAPTGIFHFVNDGEASWFSLARIVFACAKERGYPAPDVQPIATSEYPTRARRPANSRLASTRLANEYDIVSRPWELAVRQIVDALMDEWQGQPV